MPIRFTNNVRYLGKKAFVEREEYATLADMKSANEAGLNDGLIAYNHETKVHYVYRGEHTDDALTGKWKRLSEDLGGSVGLTKATNPGNFAAKYELTFKGDVVGTIDIPKDQFLSAVNYDHDTKKLKLTVQDGSEVEVSLAELVDVYTGSDDIQISSEGAISIRSSVKDLIHNTKTELDELNGKFTTLKSSHDELNTAHSQLKSTFDDHNVLVDLTRNGHLSKEQYKGLTDVVGGVESGKGRVFVMTQADYTTKEGSNSLPENAIIFIEG